MSAKHIQIKAVLRPDRRWADLHVMMQTHREKAFGKIYESSYEWFRNGNTFKHGRIRLFSCGYPANGGFTEVYEDSRTFWVFVRGDEEVCDNNTYVVEADLWPEIKAAVDAYNEWGASQ